ncbi:DUF4291 domain-containing protein [Streptomyces sp. DSM 44915]|uniref:DUF4291 domain-containing protein n=1 Tax=Streptomyces chisholmiae TaxID=3075540 RepID=A0ABU2K0N3_9ACTN|nr:DUF4291 domain-containing protein [Streptomyces sp. DSM 44915]MDT0270806.1 DUF4291 domain-containing protein [Streptomyces sp. DSM 44915]
MTEHDPRHVPTRQIRARYTEETITVYQAYGPHIGGPAARDGRFPEHWKRERMTWIKPSFRWMMYRCGWGEKPGQETVLAIEISRAGFAWALRHAALSHFDAAVHADHDAWRAALRTAPTRVQWDPERDLRLQPLDHRSLQLGLSGEAVSRYADEWLVAIRDVTPLAHRIHALVRAGDLDRASELLPPERPYPTAGLALDHLVPTTRAGVA